MHLVLDLDGGGHATLVQTSAERIVLEATRAFPPGAPLTGRARDGSGTYQVKVRSSRRTEGVEAQAFRVEGRLVNLTRGQREHLEAMSRVRDSSAGE
jgi:hypothetical protein